MSRDIHLVGGSDPSEEYMSAGEDGMRPLSFDRRRAVSSEALGLGDSRSVPLRHGTDSGWTWEVPEQLRRKGIRIDSRSNSCMC